MNLNYYSYTLPGYNILNLSTNSKSVPKVHFQNLNRYNRHIRHISIISRSVLLRISNVSGNSCRENQNTQFIFHNFFKIENGAFYEIIWKKYFRARQAIDDNMAHAYCMLYN